MIKRILILTIAVAISLVAAQRAEAADKSFVNLDKVEKVKEDHFKIKYDKYSEVELGNLETDDFEPTAKLKKWGDETYIKVKYPTSKKIKPKQEDKKLKWKDDKVEIHFYPLEPIEFEENGHTVKQLENGGFEFEIILKEKPATNKIVLSIETKGLKFYYQPELTQKEKDEGCFRPENVVGSYAVYHETKSGNYEALGGKNYQTGKAFHIYRPKMTDAIGNWTWEKMNIDIEKGTLTITIPQEFLDNAAYPISSRGTTFGYDTVGISLWGADGPNEILVHGLENLSENVNVTQISIYGAKSGAGTIGLKGIIYANDGAGGIPGTREVVSQELSIDWFVVWKNTTVTPPVFLAAGDYYLGWVIEVAEFGTYFDAIGGYTCYYTINDSYADPSNPFPAGYSTSATKRFSTYVTYTPATARRVIIIE